MSTTIIAVIKDRPLEKNERIYRVTMPQNEMFQYEVANSPGQAALKVVTVERLSPRQVQDLLIAEVFDRKITR